MHIWLITITFVTEKLMRKPVRKQCPFLGKKETFFFPGTPLFPSARVLIHSTLGVSWLRRAFFREHASFPCRTFRPACRGILFPVSSFYLTIGGSLPLRTALRVRAYQAVKHVVHSPVNTPTRDAGEVDARGLLRGVTQALPDQLHRIAGLLHQCGPGVAHHVGRQGYGKARKTPDAEGVPVHALERGFLGGFPVPVPGGGTLHAPEVVEEGEHPGGAAAAVALHKGGGLGSDQHVYRSARLAAPVTDMPVIADHVMPQVPDILESHAAGEEDEVKDIQRLTLTLRKPGTQPRVQQAGQGFPGKSPLRGGPHMEGNAGKGVAPPREGTRRQGASNGGT